MDMTTTHLGQIILDQIAPSMQPDQTVQATVNGRHPLDSLPLAMAYVPMQRWTETYEACKGLERGTIFPDLDLPFCGKGAR